MTLIKTVYRDQYGNEWTVQFETLPKKRGEYKYWTAECLNKHFRGVSKTSLFNQIKEDVNYKIQLQDKVGIQ